MVKKILIENMFFDIISLVISFIISFFRSIKLIFWWKIKIWTNIFFNFLDFIFRKWTKYFWGKPSFYKITSFIADLLNFVFKK